MQQTKTINRFDGGITDRYLSGAQENQYYNADNFLIDDNGKLYTRPGFKVFPTAINVGNWVTGIYVGSSPYNLPLFCAGPHVYNQLVGNTLNEVLGPAGTAALPNKGYTTLESGVMWRKQILLAGGAGVLPTRIYAKDATPTFQALTLGLPKLNSAGITNSLSGGAGHTYIYAAHWDYQFTDLDSTLYEERGQIGVWQIQTNAAINGGNPNAIASLPTISNTSSTNYDTANITLKIFRSTDGGVTYFFCGQVTNGTTTFNDNVPDATLQNNAAIYTDGGILGYDQVPSGALYVTQTGDTFWWATATTLYQSINGAPGACPGLYAQPMDQKIKGVSSILSFPVLFCERSVYRVEGLFDEFGNNAFTLKEISRTAGCSSNRAVVPIAGGLVWPGNGGFYFTDGYTVTKISSEINDRYQVWQNASMTGCYDTKLNLVIWTVSSANNAFLVPNDSLVVLHLTFGIKPDSVFTTISSYGNIWPTCLAYTESADVDDSLRFNLLLGESRGFFLKSSPLALTDPAIDTTLHPADFKKKAIIYDFQSIGYDLGNEIYRAYCTDLVVENKGLTDIAYRAFYRRDDGGSWIPMSECRQDGVITWGISSYLWGDNSDPKKTYPWGSSSMGSFQRPLPSGLIRSSKAQIRFTNSITPISRSDNTGLAGTDIVFKTITLFPGIGGGTWPLDCEDYQISFLNDYLGQNNAYTTQYIIQSRISDTVIQVYDPLGTLQPADPMSDPLDKWQIRGIRKHERLYLLSYTVFYDYDGMTQTPPVARPEQNG